MKHTKGPWPIRDDLITSIGQGAPICRMMTANQEWQANAHLIAAAPDLLEAVQGLMLYILDDVLEKEKKGLKIGPYEAARAAIQKARGES